MANKRKAFRFSETVPLKSGTIKAVAYEPHHCILMMHFTSGKKYYYLQVPAIIYNEFLSAPSKGKYYNQCIKQQFDVYRDSLDGFFDEFDSEHD